MKKYFSLIKACLSNDMSLFKINVKNKKKVMQIIIPLLLTIVIMVAIGSYADMFIEPLLPTGNAQIVLSLFVFVTFLFTLMEGIYKSGDLLFKCKDDNLLLSLPISKRTVMFVRIFKFYLFELLYNSLFLVPAIAVYAYYVHPSFSYYIVSLLMLILLPIIPIVLSCILGIITSSLSSKFKHKNLFQILISFIFIGVIMFFSSNMESYINKFAENANSINDIITKIYYPAGLYATLVTDFDIIKLLIFMGINIIIFAGLILIFSNFYFKINTRSKSVNRNKLTDITRNKRKSITSSIISKEFKKIFTTPVLVINAIFGLIMFLLLTIAIIYKSDGLVESLLNSNINISKEIIYSYIPIVNIILIIFGSFMSSITSSLISLEGKSLMILKILPVNPIKIIMAKVYTAIIIMLPFILVGDVLLIVYFKYSILMILLVLIASLIIPTTAELLGIIVNLKYPKLNATNDTEIVKQSTSSFISVLAGMMICGISIYGIFKLLIAKINIYIIMLGILLLFTIILLLFYIFIKKKGTYIFNKIDV